MLISSKNSAHFSIRFNSADVDIDRPRDFSVLTSDAFNEYQKRTSDLIHDEAERAMEQKQQETQGA